MKKILTILISLLFLTGCSNYHEINNLDIVSSIYIDYFHNTYYLNIEVIKDSDKSIYTGNGTSLTEAFYNTQESSKNYLYYNHLNCIILSTNVDIDEIFNYFKRNTNINNTFKIVYTNLDNIYDNDDNIGLTIKNILKDDYDFLNILKTSYSDKDLIIPIYNNSINKYYLFNKNKLVNILNDEQYQLYKILNNDTKEIIKTNLNEGYMITTINNINTNYILKNKYIINIDLDLTINELTNNIDTTKIDNISYLEEKFNNNLENNINDFINYLIDNNTDILGINNQLIKYNYEINITSHINKKGLILK